MVSGAAEAPHVVKGPNDRLADAADVCNREHLALHPVQMHHISIGSVDPPGQYDGTTAGEWRIGLPSAAACQGWRVRTNATEGLARLLVGPAPSNPRGGHIHQHLRVDAGITHGVMNAISRAGGTAIDIRVIDLENLQRTGIEENNFIKACPARERPLGRNCTKGYTR